ncbi:MAG: VWA domain-containing protein, partial [Bacteroidota bacterium]|nr:VWA domain-containing protein [Bacteroidota bacterium]
MRALLSALPGARNLLLAALLCLLSLPAGKLQAQPDLQLTRSYVQWPRIELHFRAQCQGVYRVDMKKSHFRLRDDGSEVTDFTLHAPPPSGQPFSCLLLFDASGSMAGPYHSAAIDAGRAFIDRMDGVQDEAAVYWFTETLTRARSMTTRKDWLKSAMNTLPASGGSAVWDALYQAIEELDFSASYDCRSIIVLSDGIDNSSMHTAEMVTNVALMWGIRINFIGIGAGQGYSAGQQVAQHTGGKFFNAMDPSSLVEIYRELFTDLRFCYSECSISYERDCADGNRFDVELELLGYCFGGDKVSTTFVAPLDLQTFRTLDFSLDGARVQGGNDLQMTVWLRPPVDEITIHPFTVPLQFDTSLLRLDAVTAVPGVLMNGVPLSITPRVDGALITSNAKKELSWGGPFFELHFSTRQQIDTVHTRVTLGDFWFNNGCLRSFSTSATVGLFPPGPMPLVFCESPGAVVLQWDRMSENYLPNPFPVMARFLNTGSIEAKEARFVLEYDSSVFRLRQPLQDTITYSFADITPGSHAAVSWDLESPLRYSDLRSEVCITALFDNHPPVRCCAEVEVPRADGILRCLMSAPEITVDRATGQYTPMPFPLTVDIENVGGRAADNVTARLQLPPGMQLAAPDAPDGYQKSLGGTPLPPGGKATLQWMLQHPVIPQPRMASVQVTAQSPSTAA